MIAPTLLAEIDALVTQGMFASRELAIEELIRLGLQVVRSRAPGGPRPGRPPIPPGHQEPGDDRPIDVKPWDVNWAP